MICFSTNPLPLSGSCHPIVDGIFMSRDKTIHAQIQVGPKLNFNAAVGFIVPTALSRGLESSSAVACATENNGLFRCCRVTPAQLSRVGSHKTFSTFSLLSILASSFLASASTRRATSIQGDSLPLDLVRSNPTSAWAVDSYRSGPPAVGTHESQSGQLRDHT